MFSWIMNFFKKDKVLEIYRTGDDRNIEWHCDKICLKRKNYPGMKDDFRQMLIEGRCKIKIHVKAKKEGLWEVNGVIYYADSALDAQNQYLGDHHVAHGS